MEIPKYIEIKDVNGKRTALLSPQADGLKDCYIDCKLNGDSTLEFSIPANSEKVNELTPECQIWINGKVYSLLKEDTIDAARDDNNKLWAKFMAVERWYDLSYSYVEPSISNDPTAHPPADLAVIIVGGGSNLTGGLYATGTAAHALYAILQGSGWTLGTCDVDGIHDLEIEKASRLNIIKEIQNIWGGYLAFDSVNKVVYLRDGGKWQNYNGFSVRYKKNLKNITRTQSNKIFTKIYPFGHDDLDIANVNNGEKYITNFSYTSYEYTGIYKNQDIYDQDELKEKAIAELSLVCRPHYLYKIKIVDISTLPEYSHENFSLGDMVDIIDPDIASDNPRPRLIRHKYNVFMPWDCELEIGDPEESIIEQLKASFDSNQFIDGKFNGNGNISGFSIENGTISANKIKTEELIVGDNIAMGPNAYISWDNITSQPDIAQIALDKINSTYIDANGIWTPNVYATNINVLNGKITTAQIENLVVGGNVTMGPNAVISWNQVDNIPSDLAYQDDIPDDAYITTITRNTITTGYINALEVTARKLGTSGSDYAELSGGVMRFYDDSNLYLLIQADAISGAMIEGEPRLRFYGSVDFSEASILGLNVTARFA